MRKNAPICRPKRRRMERMSQTHPSLPALRATPDQVRGRLFPLKEGRKIMAVAVAALLSLFPLNAHAESAVDPAHLTGPDRTARLIAGAKKEGTLNLYSSAIAEHMNAVGAAFEKKYGVKVVLWRGGSEEILQRIVTEARGGHFAVGVVETAAPQIIAVAREKLLQQVQTPLRAEIMPGTIIPGAPW